MHEEGREYSVSRTRKACKLLLRGFKRNVFVESGHSSTENHLLISLMIETEYESVRLLDRARRLLRKQFAIRQTGYFMLGIVFVMTGMSFLSSSLNFPTLHPILILFICLPIINMIFNVLYFRPVSLLLDGLCGRKTIRHIMSNIALHRYSPVGNIVLPGNMALNIHALGEDGFMRALLLLNPHDMFSFLSVCKGNIDLESSFAQSALVKAELIFEQASKSSHHTMRIKR